jgi:hypothetical protein
MDFGIKENQMSNENSSNLSQSPRTKSLASAKQFDSFYNAQYWLETHGILGNWEIKEKTQR